MPPKNNITKAPRATSEIDTRKLEKLIRESVRSEMNNQQSRKRTTDAYTQRLQDTDAKVTEFIQHAINETTRAYRLSVNSFIINYVAAFLVLLSGILLISFGVNDDKLFIIAIVFVAGSIIWIINLQNRNLAKNNRSLVNNLAKLNIIFAGYIRQIHQVDAVFEGLVGNSDETTSEVAEKLLNNLQDAMAEAMSAVTSLSNELED